MPTHDIQARAQTSVAFRTIGCKLNQCETAQMQQALLAEGFRLVEWDEPADIRVINTCTVTAKSDRTCRHEIHLAKRLDPDCVVAVTGCYAQVDPETIAAISGVDLVLGNIEKLRLAEHLSETLRRRDLVASAAGVSRAVAAPGAAPGADAPSRDVMDVAAPVLAPAFVSPYPDRPGFEGEFITHFYGYTRAFLKVQTGCDSRCAYCIIPLARGPARSMPRAEVLQQIRLLAARDFLEVVLTGINLGSWGRDTGEGSLADLLALLVERGEVPRYRLSSIEPLEVDVALLDVIERAGERIAHHFHLPLQSGSDPVLVRMDRPYSAAEYEAVVTELSLRFPDAALGADVIVGFPGETDAEFAATCDLVERSPLTYLHVFSYSDRPGTVASTMTAKVHPEMIHSRSLRLRALGERKNAAFHERILGSEQRALILRERTSDGLLVGLTGNYAEVLVAGDDSLTNRFVRVQLAHILPDGRWEATTSDESGDP
jgi:threonylcarbamoyladenosine tRNA methylthiotransferase MtaB